MKSALLLAATAAVLAWAETTGDEGEVLEWINTEEEQKPFHPLLELDSKNFDAAIKNHSNILVEL